MSPVPLAGDVGIADPAIRRFVASNGEDNDRLISERRERSAPDPRAMRHGQGRFET